MKTNTIKQKKAFNKKGPKINLSNYLSKIISLKDIKLDSKNNQNIKNNESVESRLDYPSKLLAQKELEIKTLKIKCEKLQEENKKYQFQNNKYKTSENTSSNFPLKKEIKELWERFARIDILNNFIDFENDPEIIYHSISEMFLLSTKIIKEKSEDKYKEIIRVMGMKNNLMNMKDIELQFKHFIKEHLNEIFKDLQDIKFLNEYKEKIRNIFKDKILKEIDNSKDKDEIFQIFSDIFEQNDFNEMIKNINNLVLIAQYNEPSLYFNIEPNIKNRKIRLVKIHNKQNYIIPNDINNKNVIYMIIINPPQIKNGIYFFKDLKQIIMPFNSNSSDKSKIEIEEEIIDLFNNEKKIVNYNSNSHILSNSVSQKNIYHKKYNNNNSNEGKNEKNNTLDKKMNNSLKVYTYRESNKKKQKNVKKIEKLKFSLHNNNYNTYWKIFIGDENSNYFENYHKFKKTSNEKNKSKRITNYNNNKRRKNSMRFNRILNSDKKIIPNFNSEDTMNKNSQIKLNETENISIKNKQVLLNSLKGSNTIKNISKNYLLKKSKKKNTINYVNYYKNKNSFKNDKKKNILNITNENKKININKLIKSHQKNKTSNYCIGDEYLNRTVERGNTNNDIKCKIKNFNINYINIGNTSKILGLNNSNIYNNINNKSKLTKDITKNNYIFLPLDDIQKIIETNLSKHKLQNSIKNIKSDYYNKVFSKKTTNKNSHNNSSMKKKLVWVKNENSLTFNNIKNNNSNNITQRHLNKRSKTNLYFSNYIHIKNRRIIFEKNKIKINYLKKIKENTFNNNNLEDFSQGNSTINSAKRANNNKTLDKVVKKKIYKNVINNIEFNNGDKSPFYIKMKNKKNNLKNHSETKNYVNNFLNIRMEKIKALKHNKKNNNSKNDTNLTLYSDSNNKIINSTSNILNVK